MKTTSSLTIFRLALTLIGGCFAASLVLPAGTAAARAFSDDGQIAAARRSGKLHATKECSEYFGAPGEWCTIASSNLEPLPVGSRIYYNQPAGIPAGLLDSNIVIDAGNGNRAVGRCTLDMTTGLGLCTVSDGTGLFAGFEARIDVVCQPASCSWDGRYSFRPLD